MVILQPFTMQGILIIQKFLLLFNITKAACTMKKNKSLGQPIQRKELAAIRGGRTLSCSLVCVLPDGGYVTASIATCSLAAAACRNIIGSLYPGATLYQCTCP
jgi:hypothetical protein